MDRRAFIKYGIFGAVSSYGLIAIPGLTFGETVFDLSISGQNFIQKKQFIKAVAVLEKAVTIDPENDWAFGLLGRAYNGLGKKREAVTAFNSAVKINPNDTFSRMMAEILSQKPLPPAKKTEKAMTPLEKEAIKEEKEMLSKIKSVKGLDYKINRVVIDAGHGGFDPGAIGKNGLKEKDVNLDIALKLHKRLKSSPVKSFLTRTGDYYVPLSARTVTANQYKADLLVSIHINANKNPKPHGAETYFCSEKASSKEAQKVAAYENSVLKFDTPYKKKAGYIDIEDILFKFEQKLNWRESDQLANQFQNKFKKFLPFKSRGVHSANFYVLRRAQMPSVLLEMGFISNSANEAKLSQPVFRDKIAKAIAKGLI